MQAVDLPYNQFIAILVIDFAAPGGPAIITGCGYRRCNTTTFSFICLICLIFGLSAKPARGTVRDNITNNYRALSFPSRNISLLRISDVKNAS